MDKVSLIVAASFLAGSIFTCVIVCLFLKWARCDDDPMDEAEANVPRNCPGACDCGSSMDSSVLLPRRSTREQKPSGRKHFAED